MKNVAIVVASIHKNLELANKIIEEVSKHEVNIELLNLVKIGLPLYTPLEEEKGISQDVIDLSAKIKNQDGFAFVAPEYNGGIPPVLTNFIAWMSRSGDDWRKCFNGKPAFIASHSGGGGQHILMSLRQQLSYIGMNVIGRQIITNASKKLNPDSLKTVSAELVKYVTL